MLKSLEYQLMTHNLFKYLLLPTCLYQYRTIIYEAMVIPAVGNAQERDRLAQSVTAQEHGLYTDGFWFPLSGPWPDSLGNRFYVVFSISSNRSNGSSCLFIKH